MADAGKPLPDFADPPVIETVLGVEFAPLRKWGIPHFGLLWNEIRTDYPNFEVQGPLASQIEQFGKPANLVPQLTFQAVAHPPVRCWFVHQSETRLLQIQNDRFIHNWRKVGAGDAYLRYEKIRLIFEKEWGRFVAFLRTQGVDAPEVRQGEVTYINHMDPGKGWKTLADLPDVVGSRPGAGTDQFLPVPETISLGTSYELPDKQGRLRVQLESAVRLADARETLQLTLTARGRPASSEVADLLRWFDLGREWVVRGFADFTTARMHEIWKRKTRP